MLKKTMLTLIALLIVTTNVSAQSLINIEVFDINKGIVVKNMHSNADIQRETESYLRAITGIFPKVNPIPESGFAVKIPLKPPVTIQSELLNASVDETIIFFPEQGKPYLMVFETPTKPVFFNFEGNTEKLLEYLDYR